MRIIVQLAGEEEAFEFQAGSFDPLLKRLVRRGSDLELHRALRLVLHDNCSGCDLIAVADVADLDSH